MKMKHLTILIIIFMTVVASTITVQAKQVLQSHQLFLPAITNGPPTTEFLEVGTWYPDGADATYRLEFQFDFPNEVPVIGTGLASVRLYPEPTDIITVNGKRTTQTIFTEPGEYVIAVGRWNNNNWWGVFFSFAIY